ncbi:hypothetical protein [Chondromyces apiculatus]|uniref:Uncharacterized protein n=1 Tax=Chondromyces apiculatus DSM 436 TaxID=1192034 RepID=A0A017TGM3_9BACT|nr:hypothetical protein [Chondromyces apiculatus]EYF08443.1 Hypothetical protein CAP_3972 [Chondromyces apiculatus DSM 436]
MSLLLIAALTAAVAASAGYAAARRRLSEDPYGLDDPPEPELVLNPDPFEGLPLRLGDVVQADREERWLAGVILARDRRDVIAAIFIAPEGTALHAVAAFAPPSKDLYWMTPVTVDIPFEPPATLEIGRVAMQRRSRVPVALEGRGQGVLDLASEGILALYDGGAGNVALVLGTGGRSLAWTGHRLEPGSYDRLGHGGDGH